MKDDVSSKLQLLSLVFSFLVDGDGDEEYDDKNHDNDDEIEDDNDDEIEDDVPSKV